jgi:hypothetical protein
MFKDLLDLIFGSETKTEQDKKNAEKANQKVSFYMIILFSVISILVYWYLNGFG